MAEDTLKAIDLLARDTADPKSRREICPASVRLALRTHPRISKITDLTGLIEVW
jgi:hypothetical protein